MIPSARDNVDRMVQLLEQIAANTGTRDRADGGDGGHGSDGGDGIGGYARQPINPTSYRIIETSYLEDATPDGSVTLEPGEEAPIVKYDPRDGGALMALGATDEPDVRYALRFDHQHIIGGWTNSPLGLINDPFSFVNEFGVVLPAEQTVEYVARYDSTASGEVDLVGRLHVQEV